MMDRMYNKLRNLDAYPKVNEDFYNRSLSGGVITLLSSFFIGLLVISEFSMYSSTFVVLITGLFWLPMFFVLFVGCNFVGVVKV